VYKLDTVDQGKPYLMLVALVTGTTRISPVAIARVFLVLFWFWDSSETFRLGFSGFLALFLLCC
jgi:hypothetical protein